MGDLSVSAPLMRVAATATPYGKVAADQDKVLDLSQTATIPQEFESANLEFIKVKTGGQELFLSLQDLQPAERTQLVGELKAMIMDGAQLKPGFDPETFFSLSGDQLSVGQGGSHISFGGNIQSAGQVVKDSNARGDDAIWKFMNNGEDSLSREGATEHVGAQKKPAAWYNGFTLADGKVTTHRSSLDTRQDVPTPQLDLEGYKAMLVRDFNFNGAIDTFKAQGGEPAFVAAMQAKYPNHPLGPDGLKLLAENIYSYASTGADKQGRTDIAEMQGMLFALDPEICKTSDSNTAMQDGQDGRPLKTFRLPGLDKDIPMGDGFHGRATILTTRHLLANTEVVTDPAPKLEVKRPFVFGKDDFFIRDGSGSMDKKWTGICGMIDRTLKDAGLLDPGQSVGGRMQTLFDERRQETLINGRPLTARQELQPVPGGTGTYGQLDQALNDYGQALNAAFSTLCPNGSKEEVEEFARLLGVPDNKLNDVFPRAGGGKRGLDSEALMTFLADQTTKSTNQAYGAGGESGLKGLITTLMFDPQFSPAAIEAMKPAQPTINVIMDEPEQSLEYLELAKALAEKRGVNVRLVVVPTDIEPAVFNANPEAYMATVDLKDISISPDRTTATYTYTPMNQDPKTVTVPLFHSATNKPLAPGEKPASFKDLCLPFLFKPDPAKPQGIDIDKPMQKRAGGVN